MIDRWLINLTSAQLNGLNFLFPFNEDLTQSIDTSLTAPYYSNYHVRMFQGLTNIFFSAKEKEKNTLSK
jgi:hypothetical protein